MSFLDTFEQQIENFSENTVDKSVEKNADFQYQSGLSPKIVRTGSNCCQWCSELAGTYSYPNVPPEVYARHSNCSCDVEYYPGDGRKQSVYDKRWADAEETISFRKNVGLPDSNYGDIIKSRKEFESALLIKAYSKEEFAELLQNNPRLLSQYTPVTFKRELEQRGFAVKPLGRGRHKGRVFEEGGGYIVHYGGNGAIEYHPAKYSRHGGRYYRMSDSEHKRRWFDTKGNEFDPNVEKTGKRHFK